MSIAYNRVIIAGNLTRDIELKYAPSGDAVGNLSIAINSKYKDKEGEVKESVVFVDCTAFGAQVENAAKFLKKGSPALIEGRLHQDTWEDKESGQKRNKMKVVVDRIQFLGTKPADEGGDSGEPEEETPKPKAKAKPASKPAKGNRAEDPWS